MKRMTPKEALKNIGLKNGKLQRCPEALNCVCSQYEDKFYIPPITYKGDSPMEDLKNYLERERAYTIIKEDGPYIHGSISTKRLKFVDDLEFLLDEENRLIHVRSASRLGIWDIGANRRRVEKIRKHFAK